MKLVNLLLIKLTLILVVSCGGGGGGGGSSDTGGQTPPINHNVELSYFLDADSSISIDNNSYGNLELLSITENPLNGSASLISGVIHYEPNPSYFGLDRIQLQMRKNGNEAILTINLTVNKLNIAPIVNDMTIFVVKGSGILFELDAFDEDGDTLTYELVGSPSFGNLILKPSNSPLWGYDSLNEEYQTYFTYRVSDGKSYSNVGTITINVTRPNQAPTFPLGFPSTASLNEDSFYNYNFSVSDTDGDIVSAVITSQPINGIVNLVNPSNNYFELTYTPDENYFGSDSLTIEISDGFGGTTSRSISLTVNPENDTPEVIINSVSLEFDKNQILGELVDFGLYDIDTANESLFIIYDSPSNLVDLYYISSSKEVLFTPKFNAEGLDTFVFRFSDGFLTTEPITVNIKVNGDPLPELVPTNKSTSFNQGSFIAFTLEGNTEGRNIQFEIIEFPIGGESTISGTIPNLVYTPETNFYGSTDLKFKIRDLDTNELSPMGFIDITVLRTDFSGTWSLDLLGNLKENTNLIEEASISFEDYFFISSVNASAEFSIKTSHMSCGRFDTEYLWVGLNTKNKMMPFSRSENWFCKDSFYIVRDRDYVITSEDVVVSMYKEKGFSGVFSPSVVDRFNYLKNEVMSCQGFSEIQELFFELGEESYQQEDCYTGIANLLKNNLNDYVESFHLINDFNNLKEGSYSLVKGFLTFVMNEDNQDSFLDKENYLLGILNNLAYPSSSVFETLNQFNSCYEYFSPIIGSPIIEEDEDPTGEPLDFLVYFLNTPMTHSQELCYYEVFNLFNSNYLEFYNKTGYSVPVNTDSFNPEIENIISDMFELLLDEENQEYLMVNESTCSPEARFLKDYYFESRIEPEQTYFEYLETIGNGACSDTILSEDIYYNNIESFFYIDNGIDEELYSPALINCHLEILKEIESSVMYNSFRTKKGQTGAYDLLNKINIGIILSSVIQNDSGYCSEEEDEPVVLSLNESIFESNYYSLYLKEMPNKKEVYFGFNKFDLTEEISTGYSIDYLGFNSDNIKRTSLVSATVNTLTQQVLFMNQLDESSNLGDYIFVPEREFLSQPIYTKIVNESNELILKDIYINNDGVMEKVKDSFIGKMFILNGKMIISTMDSDTGYFLLEVSNN